MKAVLIATGYRKELEPLVQHRPAPLLKIVDKPILVHIIEYLVKQGIHDIDIILHHLPYNIETALEDGKRWGATLAYHLARDPKYPFAAIKPAAQMWGDETVLLGRGDILPRFDKPPSQILHEHMPLLFMYPSKVWTGWGLIPAAMIAEMPLDMTEDQFPTRHKVRFSTEKAYSFLSTCSFDDILHSNFKFLSQFKHTSLFPTGARMVEPGVWLSHPVSIHPGVKAIAPIYIGENCQIKEDVQLGPEVVIENNCIINEGSIIQHSIICQRSYVGEDLNISSSIVDRNLLINLSHNTSVRIQDDFILGELSHPHFMRYPLKWLERFLAAALLVLLFPFYLLMKISCDLKKMEMLLLPASDDRSFWKTFSWYIFIPKNGTPATIFQQFFRRIPTLFNICRGESHFVGAAPRTVDETIKLPPDWQKLYLKSKVGLITLADLDAGSASTTDDCYAAESYYAAHMNVRFDLLLFLRWLKKKILTPRNFYSRSRQK